MTYYYCYYYYWKCMGSLLLLLLLLLEILRKPITITITFQTITITITITFTLLLLLNQRNITQADYKVIFKDLYYFHGITHYHRHIITDNIIIKLSWKFCGLLLSNRESNSLLQANAAVFTITITITGSIWPDYYYYYYFHSAIASLLLLLLLLLVIV